MARGVLQFLCQPFFKKPLDFFKFKCYIITMKEKKKTYKVEFTTAFGRSPYVNIILEAEDEDHARWVARNLCRFGYISNVTQEGIADYTEESHEWAYDKDYEIYS